MADQLQKGHTYADGDTVNAVTLNSLVDEAEVLKGTISEQAAVAAATTDYVLITDTSDSGNLKRALVSSLPGAGTVTSVSFAATPAAVFNDGVATATTTPSITLELAPQQQNKVLASPADGSLATPGFRTLVPADLPVGTVTIAASAIDWNLGVMFTKTLATNTTFTFTGASAGQTIRVLVVQDASHTVAWPTVRWPGGTNPVMTTGAGKRDLYTFHFIGGIYYGTFEQDFLT